MSGQDSADNDRNVVARLSRRARRGTPPKPPAPWGEKHRSEALARLHELAAERIRRGDPTPSTLPHPSDYGNAGEFRFAMQHGLLLPMARIDREVRRVRDLAEGHKVRETVCEARRNHGAAYDYDDRADALDVVRRWQREGQPGARVVRVTRVRKVSP